jgi:hypothetical protein
MKGWKGWSMAETVGIAIHNIQSIPCFQIPDEATEEQIKMLFKELEEKGLAAYVKHKGMVIRPDSPFSDLK